MKNDLFNELLGTVSEAGSILRGQKKPARRTIIAVLPVVLFAQTTRPVEPSVQSAAAKYVPGVSWRATSVIAGNFSCRGRTESAILGTSESEIVMAVFLNGLNHKPQVLKYSAKVRDAASAMLQTESLDFDPGEALGYALPGFRRSKICKGLNLSDGRSDSAHIYWNHESRRLDDWTL
jgi:hypothetical protein